MTAPHDRHATLKAALLARLSATRTPALAALTTRADDDPTIALLDAWAVVGDVLGFYHDRIADEAYLRSATERRSVLELGRLIGYELRRGLAASTYLSFTLDAAAGAPTVRSIAAGARAQSEPGPGELPQTFETVEDIAVRPAWNALPPRARVPQAVTADAPSYTVRATALVQAGDALLVQPAGGTPQVRVVRRVVASTDGRTARLDVAEGAAGTGALVESSAGAVAAPFPEPLPLSAGTVTGRLLGRRWRQADLLAMAAAQQWPIDALERAIRGQLELRPAAVGGAVHVLRARAALFGHNAPRYDAIPAALRFTSFREDTKSRLGVATFASVTPAFRGSWEGTTAAQDGGNQAVLSLDAVYPALAPGGWVVLRDGANERHYRITAVGVAARTDYLLSAKVTRLSLDSAAGLELFTLRGTTVLLQSEELTLADVPVASPVGGSAVQLDGPFLELLPGTRLAVTGPRADLPGTAGGEVRTVVDAVLDDGRTVLVLDRALDHRYVRDDPDPVRRVRLAANVARATHGETVAEVLGGGDARVPFQRFVLRQGPLTYVPSASPAGRSSLEVRVDGVRWTEVDTLVGQPADARVYVTRADDDGRVTVQFGDGRSGARLPTGADNVRATYRKGTGTPGLLGANRLTLLMTRPLGVRDVTNPVPATGGDDPEARDAARRNAPLAVLTLGRVVSLQDYADFARAFGGVARVHATWAALGGERGVLLTVSGPRGEDVLPGSDLETNLLAAIRQAGDPTVPVRLVNRRRVAFQLQARVRTHPDHVRATVLHAAEAALRRRFGFDARDFGQGVTLAEVMAAVHEVPGVEAVDVDALYRPDEQAAVPNPVVPAHVPAAGTTDVAAAELLLLDPRPLGLGEFA